MSKEPKEKSFEERKKDVEGKMKAKYGRKFPIYKSMDHMALVRSTIEKDKKIDDLASQVIILQREIEKLKSQLKIHDPKFEDPPDYSGFSYDWTNLRKIVFILRRNPRPLSSSQVLGEIIKLEPSKEYDWSDPLNNVSRILNSAVKKNIVVRIGAEMGYPLYKAVKPNDNGSSRT